MALRIPAYGEAFLGDNPHAMRVLKVIAGDDSTVVDVTLSVTNTTGYELVNLNAGVLIYDVAWRLTESFSAGVDITLGMDTDLDAFAIVTDIDATESAYNLRSMKDIYSGNDTLVDPTTSVALFGGIMATGDSQNISLHLAVEPVVSSGQLEVYIFYAYFPTDT